MSQKDDRTQKEREPAEIPPAAGANAAADTGDVKDELKEAVEEGKARGKSAWKTAREKTFGESWTGPLKFWNWHKTVPLFVKNFFVELFNVQEEKKDVKDKTESEVAEQVVKGTETFDIAENLADEMDKEAHFEPEEKEAVAILTEDVLEAAEATGEPEEAIKLVARVQEDAAAKKEDPEAITDSQIRLGFSTGLFTMARLRQRFDSEEELADFLTKIKSASGKSAKFKELSLYIGNNFRKLFQFKATQVPDLLGYEGFEKVKFLKLLGSTDKLSDGLDMVLPDLFPSAVKDKGLAPLRKFFVRFVQQKRYPDPKAIAELIFMIEDEDDMRTLAQRIGGTKIVSLASVKATEARKVEIKKKREADAVAKKKDNKDKAKEKPVVATKDNSEKEPQQGEAA
ncbi:MAG: hypothetical protein WC285_03065 [Candidatus Gracilibacteria bacterium]|jgi:hypothetical protein